MNVFTILCHGTSQHSGIKKNGNPRLLNFSLVNIIHHLSQEMDGAVCKDYLILEGVGSDGDPGNSRFDPQQGKLVKKGTGIPHKLTQLLQGATGQGVEENVKTAIDVLQSLSPPPMTVNLIGWSRGAVTAIRIAYQMFHISILRSIKVNIFSIDPVAGPGHSREPEAYTLMDNVACYVALYAIHEDRLTFKPTTENSNLHIKNPNQTQCLYLPFPGVHETLVQHDNVAGELVNHLAYRFLKHFGSRMRKGIEVLQRTDTRCLQCYIRLMMGRGGTLGIHQVGNYSAPEAGVPTRQDAMLVVTTGIARSPRTIDAQRQLNQGFFFNPHHRVLFKRLLPQTYDLYFEPRPSELPSGEVSIRKQFIPEELAKISDPTNPGDVDYLNTYLDKIGQAGHVDWQSPMVIQSCNLVETLGLLAGDKAPVTLIPIQKEPPSDSSHSITRNRPGAIKIKRC